MSRYDDKGNYITDPPQSRIEERLRRIEDLIKSGGGGGDDPANTASEEDIEGIVDDIWPDTDPQP